MKYEIIKLIQGLWKIFMIVLVGLAGIGCMFLYKNETIPETENSITNLDQAINDNESYILDCDDEVEINRLKIQNDVYEYCKDKNIVLDRSYVSNGVYEAIELLEMKYDSYSKSDIEKGNRIGNALLAAISKKDFKKYIKLHLEALNLLKSYSGMEKLLEKQKSEFWLNLDSQGTYNYFSSSLVSYYYRLKKSLLEDKNYCYINEYNNNLSEDEKKIFQSRVYVLDYIVKNGYLNTNKRTSVFSSNTILKNMYYAGNIIILFFLIYLSASSFGGEIEKQTIKNLLISPKTRTDIFRMKFFSLLLTSAVLHILVYLVISIIGYVFMGGELMPGFYITESGIKHFNVFGTSMIGQVIQCLESMVWILGTILVSIVLRNRGVSSIIVSLFYIVNEYCVELVEKKSFIIKYFLPSYYGNINQRLFDVGNFETDYLLEINTACTKVPLWICFLIIVLTGVLLYFIGNLLFKNKDY